MLQILFFVAVLSVVPFGLSEPELSKNKHIGLDISKQGKITLTWINKETSNQVEHAHFDSCVLVECQTGTMRAGTRKICDETKKYLVSDNKRNDVGYCAVIENVFQLPEPTHSSVGAVLNTNDDDVVYYEVDVDRRNKKKQLYFEQVVDVLFSRIRQYLDSKVEGRYNREATLMVPAKYLYEERELVIAGLALYGIEVVEVIRCHPSECENASQQQQPDTKVMTEEAVDEEQERLDWAVLKRVRQEGKTTYSHDVSSHGKKISFQNCREGSGKECREPSISPNEEVNFPTESILSEDVKISHGEKLLESGGRLFNVPSDVPSSAPMSAISTDSPTAGARILPSAIPSDSQSMIPTFSSVSILPSVMPTTRPSSLPTKIPTRTPSAHPSISPSHTPTAIPATTLPTSVPTTSRPSTVSSRTPTKIPTFSPSSVPSSIPSIYPSFSSGGYAVPTLSPDHIPTDDGIYQNYNNARRSGILTAGDWSDVKEFPFWKSLMNCDGSPPQCWSKMEKKWHLCTAYPITVSVTQLDDDLSPADLTVKIFSDSNLKMKGRGRTNVDGRVTVFLMIEDDDGECDHQKWNRPNENTRLVVQIERQFMGEFDLKNIARDPQTKIPHLRFVIEPIQQRGNRQQQQGLDLMFVTDTTGSMSDEISFLQSDLGHIIEAVQRSCHGQLRIRTSVNFYRDVGDVYVVKNHPFDESISRNVRRLLEESAGGGGDFPEAVEVALNDAVFGHEWSVKGEVKARLLFLVLDAPPHSNEKVFASLVKTLKKAQSMGIRIIPVTGSGIDKNTEFLMRMFGIVTDGRYLHLTDDSGVGLPHLETKTTMPPHPVGKLRDVIVRIIEQYLGC